MSDKPSGNTLKQQRAIEKAKKIRKKQQRAGKVTKKPTWDDIHHKAIETKRIIDKYGEIAAEAEIFLINLPAASHNDELVKAFALVHNEYKEKIGEVTTEWETKAETALGRSGDVLPEGMSAYHLEYVNWMEFQAGIFTKLQAAGMEITTTMIKIGTSIGAVSNAGLKEEINDMKGE